MGFISHHLIYVGWGWRPEDRPSFEVVSTRMNAISDINESKLSLTVIPIVLFTSNTFNYTSDEIIIIIIKCTELGGRMYG